MTIDEILERAAKRGPWQIREDGKIRNGLGCCPIEAAAHVLPGRYVVGAAKLGLESMRWPRPGSDGLRLVRAADNCPDQKLLRRKMERILLGKAKKTEATA